MVLPFFNETGFIANIIVDLTNNITGSIFITLLLIMILFLLVPLLFRLPMEISAVLLIPLLIVFMASTSEFIAVGGIFLIYLGVILAKNFFLK